MSDERELRDALEHAQARLQEAEQKMADIDRRRSLAEQRTQEFERQVAADRERIALLEEQLKRAEPGGVETELATVRARLETLELRLKQVDSVAPRLPASGVCTRCGSSEIVGRVELAAINAVQNAAGGLNATIDRDPGAAFFKDPVYSRVWAAVCGRCGYLELNTDAARALYDAWARRTS